MHPEKSVLLHNTLLTLAVIVRAVRFFANTPVLYFALVHFVVNWVVLEFFPAMTGPAPVFQSTSVFVSFDVFLGFPGHTLHRLVLILRWLPSEVLPIVSINTLISLVFLITERTPDSFKVEQVKI